MIHREHAFSGIGANVVPIANAGRHHPQLILAQPMLTMVLGRNSLPNPCLPWCLSVQGALPFAPTRKTNIARQNQRMIPTKSVTPSRIPLGTHESAAEWIISVTKPYGTVRWVAWRQSAHRSPPPGENNRNSLLNPCIPWCLSATLCSTHAEHGA